MAKRTRKLKDLGEPVPISQPLDEVMANLPAVDELPPPQTEVVTVTSPGPRMPGEWKNVQNVGDGWIRMKLVNKRGREHLQIKFDDETKPTPPTKARMAENGWRYWPKGKDWAYENWVFPLKAETHYQDVMRQEEFFKDLVDFVRAENGIGRSR